MAWPVEYDDTPLRPFCVLRCVQVIENMCVFMICAPICKGRGSWLSFVRHCTHACESGPLSGRSLNERPFGGIGGNFAFASLFSGRPDANGQPPHSAPDATGPDKGKHAPCRVARPIKHPFREKGGNTANAVACALLCDDRPDARSAMTFSAFCSHIPIAEGGRHARRMGHYPFSACLRA